MVGRDVLLRVDKTAAQPGDVVLSVDDLHVVDERGIEKVRGVSFEVRAGEIVGIAGVDGNGQTELIDANRCVSARSRAAPSRSPGRHSRTQTRGKCSTPGVGHIPEDRAAARSSSSSRSPRTSLCTTTRTRSERPLRLALSQSDDRARGPADQGVRRARRRPADARRRPLWRQPAVFRRRAGDLARPEDLRIAAQRRAASTWGRSSTCTGA